MLGSGVQAPVIVWPSDDRSNTIVPKRRPDSRQVPLWSDRLFGRSAPDQAADKPISPITAACCVHRGAPSVRARVKTKEGVAFEPAHHGPFAAIDGDRNAVVIKGDDGREWRARGRGTGRW